MTYQVFVAKMSMIPVRSVIDIATTIIFCILSSCFASFRKKHRQISAKKKARKQNEKTTRRKRIKSIIFSSPSKSKWAWSWVLIPSPLYDCINFDAYPTSYIQLEPNVVGNLALHSNRSSSYCETACWDLFRIQS